MPDVPHDLEAEQAVLGCALLTGSVMPKLSTDLGLRPHHFYRDTNGRIYEAALAISDAGAGPDAVAVCAELERRYGPLPDRERHYVHSLSAIALIGNWERYARIVLELAQLRRIREGAWEILEGVDRRDNDAIERGEQKLIRADGVEQRTSTPSQLADELYAQLDSNEPVESFRWPFPRLDKLTLGGMRRGQLALIAGWAKMGKSIWLDQCLSSFANAGLRVHLFINEMTRRERTERTVARLSGVPFDHIATNILGDVERSQIVSVLNTIPFGITDCSGWSGQDVAREVKRNRYDVVGIDILNRFPGVGERKVIEEISRSLNELAKPSQGNCAILLAAHLNRNRVGQSLVLPFPTVGDLRETGMLANDADFTVFVHRDQDEDTGDALATGLVRVAIARTGRPGAVPVSLNAQRMEFEPVGASRPSAQQELAAA